MPKVHSVVVGEPMSSTMGHKQHVVVFNKLSLVWSVVFSINLAFMPMKAYWTEYYPWSMPSPPTLLLEKNPDDFHSYTSTTSQFLQNAYNSDTFPDPNNMFLRDPASPTYAVRYTVKVPYSVPAFNCLGVVLTFPGQLYYGQGIRDFVCAFAALNQSARADSAPTWTKCQHEYLLGQPIAEGCIWAAPAPPSSASNDNTTNTMSYAVYFGRLELQGPTYNWFKFAFRSCLTLFIVCLLWRMYFAHYRPLVANLGRLGLGDGAAYEKFELLVGDPTPIVLSHPLVCLVFVWDVWLSPVYFGLATIRVSQFSDWWIFFLGCLYGSRTLWFAYFTMRYATYAIKRWHVEHRFAAIDPGLVAMAVVVFSGPMMWVTANTALATYFYFTWSIFDTSSPGLSIETFPGAVSAVLMISLIPFTYSILVSWVDHTNPTDQLSVLRYACTSYNDLKTKLLMRLQLDRPTNSQRDLSSSPVIDMVGGSVYALMDKQPMAKRLPLFSLRGSDCFVSCMDGHGNVVKKLRLTLLDCVDVAPIALKRHRHQTTTMATASRAPTNQSKSPANGIALCPLDHPHQSFCLVNRQICAGLYATAPTYVHLGASKCKWVL